MNIDNYFPYFEYRAGQKEMVEKIIEEMKDNTTVGFRAPCGFGKSMFKTIQAIGRITRDIYNKKRLIILGEKRFLNNLTLLPKYLTYNYSNITDYDILKKEVEEFWK